MIAQQIHFLPAGTFKYTELIPDEDFNFPNQTLFLDGTEKEMFIRFAKRMLAWVPEERATARELLGDPWLTQ